MDGYKTDEALKKQLKNEKLDSAFANAQRYNLNISDNAKTILKNRLNNIDNADNMLTEEEQRNVKEMFMVDVQASQTFAEDFPELVNGAQEYKQSLEAQKNVSGLKKVFSDFTGSKKRNAIAKLNTIKTSQEAYADNAVSAAAKYLDYQEVELKDSYKKWAQDISVQIVKATERLDEKKKQYVNPTPEQEEEINGLQEELEILKNRYDEVNIRENDPNVDIRKIYARGNNAKSGKAKISRMVRKVRSAYNVYTKNTINGKTIYSQIREDAITRDLAFLISSEKEYGEVTEDQLKDGFRNAFILSDGYEPDDEEMKPVSKERKKEAYDYIKKHAFERYEEIKKYMDKNPRLFTKGVSIDPMDVVMQAKHFSQLYNMLQVTKSAMFKLIESPLYWELNEDQQEELSKKARIMSGAMGVVSSSNAFCGRLKNLDEKDDIIRLLGRLSFEKCMEDADLAVDKSIEISKKAYKGSDL